MKYWGWANVACCFLAWGCGSDGEGSDDANGGTSSGGSSSGGGNGTGGDESGTGGIPDGAGGGAGGNASGGENGAPGGNGGLGGETASGGETGTGGSTGGPLPPALVWRQEGPDIFGEGIWGSGPNDIYAVGRSGDLIHSTGDGNWLYQTTDTGADLTGISGSGATDIYVSVNSNMILHSTGDGMWEKQIQTPGYTFRDIWVASPSDIYAIGPGVLYGTGSGEWVVPPQDVTNDGTTLPAVWALAPDDIYVLAANGKAHHSTGDGSWSEQVVQPQALPSVQDIHGVEGSRIYAVGAKDVFSSSGDGVWTPEAIVIPDGSNARGVWVASPEAVFLCTSAGEVFRSNGAGTWSSSQLLGDSPHPGCEAIWGTGPDNIYLATSDGVYHGTLE